MLGAAVAPQTPHLAVMASAVARDGRPTPERPRAKEAQKLTGRRADGAVRRAISADLLCQAGIYASTL